VFKQGILETALSQSINLCFPLKLLTSQNIKKETITLKRQTMLISKNKIFNLKEQNQQ